LTERFSPFKEEGRRKREEGFMLYTSPVVDDGRGLGGVLLFPKIKTSFFLALASSFVLTRIFESTTLYFGYLTF
jgi:hypothetical protein